MPLETQQPDQEMAADTVVVQGLGQCVGWDMMRLGLQPLNVVVQHWISSWKASKGDLFRGRF